MTFRTLRRRAGFSQYSLAACARIGRRPILQETISQLERGAVGDPRYSTVRALARALGTDADTVATAIQQSAARRRRIRRSA